jgi:hypothetical protein
VRYVQNGMPCQYGITFEHILCTQGGRYGDDRVRKS